MPSGDMDAGATTLIAAMVHAAVRIATTQLVPVVKLGDMAAITAAYKAVENACYAPDKQFRKAQ